MSARFPNLRIYAAALAVIIVGTLIDAGVLWQRKRAERRVEESVRREEAREADQRLKGATSDYRDNLWADADQYVWMQKIAVRKTREIPVQVDGSISRVLFVVGGETAGINVTLREPLSGKATEASRSSVHQWATPQRHVTEIKQPIPGRWTITLKTNDIVDVLVRAQSPKTPVSLERVDMLVQDSTGPASVQNMLCCGAGTPAEAHLGVRGPALSDVHWVLMATDGTRLQDLAPREISRTRRALPGEFDYVWMLKFRYPEGPFRLMLEADEKNAGPITRFYKDLFEPLHYRPD